SLTVLILSIIYIIYLFITNKPIGIITFYLITFISHIFFLVIIPLEGLFYIQVKNATLNPYFFLTILSLCATFAYYINYKIGEKIPKKAFKSYLGKDKFNKYKSQYDKYGYALLFIAASTPFLPGPIFSLLNGFFKENINKTLIISFMGLLIKWVLFYIIFLNTYNIM
ncbi:MAG: VTT domain-containing protein, partial [Nanoarchaeales archaeon]|nr:VTT domain-containing protein [Nanoarchaeales archaeon]